MASKAATQPEAEKATIGALHGVRVLDLSRLVAGNALSHVLADMGAEVVKVEEPKRGDDLRHWRFGGVSTWWKVYCRGKKSLALNLKTDEGRAILLRMLRDTDVLVENFVPGTLERMGLGPAVLHEAAPHLVIARISGWGQTGPWANRPGFGTLVEAMSGFAAQNGYPDRPPTLPPNALADMICGLYGAAGVLAALRHVEVNGGQGQVLDLSLFDAIFSTVGPEATNFHITGTVPERSGSRSNISSPRGAYRCKDGKYVAMSAAMQSMFERLMRAIGHVDLIDDPRFANNAERLKHGDELDALIGGFILRQTREEVLAFFEQAGVTVGPICDIADLMEHPFVHGRQSVIEVPDRELGPLPMHNLVVRMSGTPGTVGPEAPALGEHSEALLAEAGFTSVEIAALREQNVIA